MNSTQSQFIAQYGGYASYASVQLGIPKNYILGQWALETGWGKSLKGNNLGNIMGAGGLNQYPSISAGVNDYIRVLQLPRYKSAIEAGKTGSAAVFGAMMQKANYAPDDPLYGAHLAATIGSVGGGYETSNSITAESNNAKQGVIDMFDKVTNYITEKGYNMAFIGVGILAVVGMIYFSLKDSAK